MTMRLEIEVEGPPLIRKSHLNKMLKDTLADYGKHWHRKFRKPHFSNLAYARYGYKRRKRGYNTIKKRRFGHTLPLVFSGKSRQLSKVAKVTSTKNRFKVSMPVRVFNFRSAASDIDKRKEFQTVAASEVMTMDKQATRRLENRVRRYKVKRKLIKMSVFIKGKLDSGEIEAGNHRIEGSFDKVRASERRARQESSELFRLVKTGSRAAETATEKHAKQVKILSKALDSGKINQQEFTAASRQANRELAKTGELSGDAFNVSGILQAVTAYASVSSVLSGVRTILQDIREEAERVAENNREAAGGLGELAQVATGSQDLANLRQGSRDIFASGAVGSRQEASQLRFAVRSASLDSDLATFIQLGQSQLVSSDWQNCQLQFELCNLR